MTNKAQVEALTAELEALRSNSCSQNEQQRRDVISLEELLAKKTKEIYDLTVQLGCLKEENHQVKRDLEDQHESHEQRLSILKSKMATEIEQLQEEYQQYQVQCSVDAEILRKQADDIEKLKKEKDSLELRLKKRGVVSRASNEKLASRSGHSKTKSSFRLEQAHNTSAQIVDQYSLNSSEINVPITSHYASVQTVDKPSQPNKTVKQVSKKADKENIETVLSIMA